MISDIEFWLAQGADRLQFYDGNFFLGRARLIAFCDALVASGLHSRFGWIATAVGRRIAKMDDELLARLKHAGLVQVAIGANPDRMSCSPVSPTRRRSRRRSKPSAA